MMERCARCGGPVVRSRKHEMVRVVDRTSFVAKVSSSVCRKCSAVFLHGRSLEEVDLEIGCRLAIHGRASGASFRFMRKALALRGAEVAELLGVTAETVSRWENGQRAVDPIAWISLGSLVLEKNGLPSATLERLLALKKRARLPKTMLIQPRNRRTTNGGSPRP
jgi:DNA-binding transcriptional regulator YiaG